MKWLLDSVIVIDQLNDVAEAVAWVDEHADGSVISSVTVAEVLAGYDAELAPLAATWLEQFDCVALDRAVATLAGRLRSTTSLKLPDAFQAAIAMHHELTLVTRNTKDFPKSAFPFVEVPYRLR
jgi:predicted nucleic acid-binding protein